MRLRTLLAFFLAALALAACDNPTVLPPHAVHVADADTRLVSDQIQPLPLRVPIQGVMIGLVDFSSYGIFKLATSDAPLTDSDWTAAGYAAVNLIGASSLITLPGIGQHDAEWVADRRWRAYASALQASSIDAGIAIRERNRDKLNDAADRIATACTACHSVFRPYPSRPAPRQYARN